jgi:hypothetical protein
VRVVGPQDEGYIFSSLVCFMSFWCCCVCVSKSTKTSSPVDHATRSAVGGATATVTATATLRATAPLLDSLLPVHRSRCAYLFLCVLHSAIQHPHPTHTEEAGYSRETNDFFPLCLSLEVHVWRIDLQACVFLLLLSYLVFSCYKVCVCMFTLWSRETNQYRQSPRCDCTVSLTVTAALSMSKGAINRHFVVSPSFLMYSSATMRAEFGDIRLVCHTHC